MDVISWVRGRVESYLCGTDYQLVGVEEDTSSDTIIVSIDSLTGVDMDFCANLNTRLRSEENTPLDDYELEVGSVSITAPFTTPFQYQKHRGEDVEVLDNTHQIYRGTLVGSDDQTFTIHYELLETLEGMKRKSHVHHDMTFRYDNILYTKLILKI